MVPVLACRYRALLVLALVASCALRAQTLEEVRDAVRAAASEVRYPLFAIALTSIAEDSELSGSRFKLDDEGNTRLTTFSLPWRGNFFQADNGNSLRVETTLGYASAKVSIDDFWEYLHSQHASTATW